jgi:tetratricopeptide (TPR) repeat protein
MSHRTMTRLAALALVLLGAAAYLNSFRGAFVFDDVEITSSHAIRHLWPIGPVLAGPRPIVDLTFAINYAIGGLNVTGYHAVNLAIHLLAGLALFGIIRRTLTLPSFCGRFSEKAATALAFCAALLWVVHPLQTQAVTYIIQRGESLAGLLYLITLYCVIRVPASPKPTLWQTASVAACALGMGCKQVMVTAPLAMLLYDRTFIAGSFREVFRRRWGLYLALAATWLILGRSVLAAFSSHPASAGFAVPGLTPLAYAWSELGVILHYLRLAFWPSGLCLDYGWPIARTAAKIVPGAIVVGGLLAATVWAVVRPSANRAPDSAHSWGFAGAWFFLALAPTSSFLPIQDLAFEHRMYLPLAAPATAAVVAAYIIGQRLLRKPVARALAIALLSCATAALICLTVLRNADYHSAVSIWQDAATKRPDNPRAWNFLGAAWVEAGRPEKALDCCNAAIAKNPNYADAYNNRAVAHGRLGEWNLALPDSDVAIRLKPDFAPNYYNRGKALAALTFYGDAAGAYTKAIERDPFYAEAWHSRGNAYGRMGRLTDAVRDFTRAIEMQPDYATAYNDRAVAWFYLKRFDKARADVRAAEQHGCSPDSAFLKALTNAVDPQKKTEP